MKSASKAAGAVLALAMGLCLTTAARAQAVPDEHKAAANLATSVCATCHGAQGRGDNPLVPHLAGQQRGYLEVQLKAFRSQSRSDPEAHDYMWGISSTLNDGVVAGLAEYFASIPPVAGKPGPADAMARGGQLYAKGDDARGVVPCVTCHGANAEGTTVFPRLAGQHGQYLYRQMQMFNKRLRASPVMHGVIKDLSEDDMRALATWLQSR